MLIDRTHRSWAMISTVILALGIVSYMIYAGASEKGATGGSLPGLIYGVIGTAMMVFAGLLAARKKVSFWRLGSAQFWLRGHLWLGGLSFPFILFHSGFAFGGVLEQILMWIFVAVWLSGFYGLAMQHLLPQLLTSRVERETFLAQVPYIRRRNRVMSDRMVFAQCGPIPLTKDPMKKELERLVRHGKKVRDLEAAGQKDEARTEKTKWAEHVDDFDLALFQDIARISKTNGWIRTVNDLTPYLFDVYLVKGVSDLKETAAEEQPTKKGGTSPLDAIKAGARKPGGSPLDAIKAGAKKSGGSPLDAIKAGAKKPGGSPLDRIKAGAKKPGGSPLDQIKAGAKKPGGSPLDQIKAGAKKPGGSPLDQIKAGAKKPAAAKPGGSPLEQIRASMGGGGKAPSATATLSPIEQIRASVTGTAASVVTAVVPKAAPVATTSNKPAIIPQFVPSVDGEISSIEKLLVEKYGYDAKLAGDVSGYARPFLKRDDEDPDKAITAITSLLIDKYGYEASLAADVAERARPFIGASTTEAPVIQSSLPEFDEDPDEAVEAITTLFVEKYGYDPALAADVAELARPFIGVTAAEAPVATDSSGTAAEAVPVSALAASSNPIIAKILASAPGGGGKPVAKKAEPKGDPVKKAPAPKAIVPKKKSAAKVPILRTKELRGFYLDEVRPYMAGNPRVGRLASSRESNRAFSQMRGTLPVELHETLAALQARCDEHRQFADQIRIHHWLHYWLILHIPFSMVLYVLMIVHIVMALRVVPFTFSLFGG